MAIKNIYTTVLVFEEWTLGTVKLAANRPFLMVHFLKFNWVTLFFGSIILALKIGMGIMQEQTPSIYAYMFMGRGLFL